jgi:hypothetical protein
MGFPAWGGRRIQRQTIIHRSGSKWIMPNQVLPTGSDQRWQDCGFARGGWCGRSFAALSDRGPSRVGFVSGRHDARLLAGLVCVRIASRSCSVAMIQKTVSSRKFRLRGSVVGGMRCTSLPCVSDWTWSRLAASSRVITRSEAAPDELHGIRPTCIKSRKVRSSRQSGERAKHVLSSHRP